MIVSVTFEASRGRAMTSISRTNDADGEGLEEGEEVMADRSFVGPVVALRGATRGDGATGCECACGWAGPATCTVKGGLTAGRSATVRPQLSSSRPTQLGLLPTPPSLECLDESHYGWMSKMARDTLEDKVRRRVQE